MKTNMTNIGATFTGRSYTVYPSVKNSLRNVTLNVNFLNENNLVRFMTNIRNLQTINFINANMSNITNFSEAFFSSSNIQSIDVSNWGMNNATDLFRLFSGCGNLTTLDVSNWNVNNVQSLSGTFGYCYNLTTLDVSKWNTSNMYNLHGAFSYCNNLITLDVSNWNMSNVKTLLSTFIFCNNLTTLDVSNWDISNVNLLYSTFSSCVNLTDLNVSNWNTSNVINMGETFNSCRNLTILDVSNWDVSNATTLSSMFARCYNLTTLDVSNWNVSNVKNLAMTFDLCNNLTELNVSNWNIINTNNLAYTFSGCNKLTSLNVSNWDTRNVKSMTATFAGCNNLTTLDLSNWNTINVNNMAGLFSHAPSTVVYGTGLYNLKSLNVANWDVSNVDNLTSIFSGCNNLTTLNVANWNTINVKSCFGIFSDCSNLTSLNVSNWNISNVNNLRGAFTGCSNLTTLDIFNWNVINVKTLESMFSGCKNLINLNISNWDIRNVTTTSSMFTNCTNLKELDVSNWNLNNIITLVSTFRNCNNLTTLDLSNWKINNTDITYMFYQTGSGNWNCDYSNDYTGTQFFGGVTFNFIPYWNFSNITNMAYFLYNTNCGYIPLYSIHDDTVESRNMINIDWHTDKVVNIAYAFAFNSYLPYCENYMDWGGYNINGPDGQTNWFFNFNNVTNAQSVFNANSYWVTWVEDTDFSNVKVMGADYLLYLNNTEKIIDARGMFSMAKPCNSEVMAYVWDEVCMMPTFNIQTPILNLNNATDVSSLFYNYQPIITNWGNGTWNDSKGQWDWWPTSNSMKKTLPSLILNSVTNLYQAYYNTRTPIDTRYWNLSRLTNFKWTFNQCNVLDNTSLKNIANVLLTATNISSTFKNLNNQNTASAFYFCNKQINANTIGTDLCNQLMAAGWIVPNATWTNTTHYKLAIEYVSEEGKQMSSPLTQYFTLGQSYSITSPSIQGFAADQSSCTGTVSSSNTIVRRDVIYTRNSYNLTVRFVDTNGTDLINPYENIYKYEQNFNVQLPTISGYTCTKQDGWYNGTMPARNIIYTAIYLQN